MPEMMERRIAKQIKIGWGLIAYTVLGAGYNMYRGNSWWWIWPWLALIIIGACVLRLNYGTRRTLDEIQKNRAPLRATLRDITRRLRNGDR